MTGESLVKNLALPLRRHIEPLVANPQLGEEELQRPFRYNTDRDVATRHFGYYSNCCGTAAYILGLSESVYRFQHDRDIDSDFPLGNYLVIPEAMRPGYIGPAIMTVFVDMSGVLKPVQGMPKPGDLIVFRRRGKNRIIHSGIYLGVENGCELFFCQYEGGENFGFNSVNGFVEAENGNESVEFGFLNLP